VVVFVRDRGVKGLIEILIELSLQLSRQCPLLSI
jgi:hypothetical protein